jgi:outer membrane usher protein
MIATGSDVAAAADAAPAPPILAYQVDDLDESHPFPVEVSTERPSTGPVAMVLDTSVDGGAGGRLIAFVVEDGTHFSAQAADLRALRLRLDPSLPGDALVRLDAVRGLSWAYDEAKQAIALTVPAAMLAPSTIELGGAGHPTDLSRLRPIRGLLMNYGLYGATGGGQSMLTGNGELLAMSGVGTLSTTGQFTTEPQHGIGHRAVRLDSAWQLVDAAAIRSYTVGDFVSNALSWTSSLRLAGIQVQSAFEQRTDLVTSALPQLSGSVALPSTLDLYVNNIKTFSGQIPAGPFDLQSLPSITGGDVRLVTTDATGRQVTVTRQFYDLPGQLRSELTEYSFDLGIPRYDYGLASFHYYRDVVGSVSVRHAISMQTTLEGHVEAVSDGLANGGLGILQSFGFGAVAASAAVSDDRGMVGGKVTVDGQILLAGIHLYADTARTIGTYMDYARLVAVKDARRLAQGDGRLDSVAAALTQTAQASIIDRAGLAFQPWFDPVSISVSYNRIRSPGIGADGGDEFRTVQLSASRSLSRRLSLYASGYVEPGADHRYGAYATLNIRLGGRTSAQLGIEEDGGHASYLAQVSSNSGQRQNALDWSVSERRSDGTPDWRSAMIGYRSGEADVQAEIDQSGGTVRGTAQIEGAFVAAAGDVFAANRIGNAFAVVRGAGPDTPISQAGSPTAVSNRSGDALLPDLMPYWQTRISMDPTNLPQGYQPSVTQQDAVAGYRQGTLVDFGTRQLRAAIVRLVAADGKPPAPGLVAHLDGVAPDPDHPDAPGTGLVGYDGELYLTGVAAHNHGIVELGGGKRCVFDFDYDPGAGAEPRIGPVPCR